MKSLAGILIPMILFLSGLTGCTWNDQIVKYDRTICVEPPAPLLPSYFPVGWVKCEDMYCISEADAKNLLLNRELDRGYQQDVNAIFEKSVK